MFYRISFAGLAFALFASVSPCQQTSLVDPTRPGVAQTGENHDQTPPETKRILGIIPKFRTSPSLQNYKPLTSGEKFKVAYQDAFDRGTVGLAALFGVKGQLTNANRSVWDKAVRDLAGISVPLWRSCNRRLHDRGGPPHASPPGTTLLSTRDRKRMVQARLRYGADLLDASRFGRDAAQLLGSSRKVNRGSNFNHLLCWQPDSCRRRV
jgi:hypothetical protein